MRVGTRTRAGLSLSLGILVGIAMIFLPGFLTVGQSPFLATHGFTNGNNNNHPSNSTTTTRTVQTNSTSTNTDSPRTLGTSGQNSTHTATVSEAGSNQTKLTKAPSGSIASGLLPADATSSVTSVAILLLVSTILIPALGLSILARTWSLRRVNRKLEEYSSA